MSSDVGSQAIVSDPSQPFEPRPDDHETLFAVIEITAEKNGFYRVRWEGNDPQTMKPWKQSWVKKHDVTDDLVMNWKRKKKEKEIIKLNKKGRNSNASKRTARPSVASTSRAGRSESTATTSTVTKRGRERLSSAGVSNPDIKGKGKSRLRHFEEDDVKEENELESKDEGGLQSEVIRVNPEVSSTNGRSTTQKDKLSENKPKGTKRKFTEAHSANSSANQTFSRRRDTIDVEADGSKEKKPEVVIFVQPKKRKIMSDGRRELDKASRKALGGQGHNKSQLLSKESYNVGKGGKGTPAVGMDDELESEEDMRDSPETPVASKTQQLGEDEDEERAVEDVLSQSLRSPGRNDVAWNDDLELPTADNAEDRLDLTSERPREAKVTVQQKAKVTAVTALVQDSDDDEIEIIEGNYRLQPPAPTSATAKAVSTKPAGSPSGKKHLSARIVAPPPIKVSSSSNTTRKPLAAMAPSKPNSKSRPNPLQPTKTAKNATFAAAVAPSGAKGNSRGTQRVCRDSDSDRTPPPLEWNWNTQHPTAERAIVCDDGRHVVEDSDDPDSGAMLSPRTRERLEIFDAEVLGKKRKSVGEKRRQNGGMGTSIHLPSPGQSTTTNNPNSKHSSSSTSASRRPIASIGRSAPQKGRDSYIMDVVPETEVENSQSQGRELYATVVRQQRPVFDGDFQSRPVTPNGSANGGLKSKMKPRTPVSRTPSSKALLANHPDANRDTNGAGPSNKPFRPLPQLSPSAFHPHLQPPDSSLPETIMEPSSSNERQTEIETIEEFESPEKEFATRSTKKVVVLNKNGANLRGAATKERAHGGDPSRKESAQDVWDSEFVKRGKKIAEEVDARRKRRESASSVIDSDSEKKKKSLQDVVAIAQSRGRSEELVGDDDDNQDEEPQFEEEGVADASTLVVPPASGPPVISQEQAPQIRSMPEEERMEDADIDLTGDMHMDVDNANAEEDADETRGTVDGDTHAEAMNPELLRQEEEESTQDLMAEIQQMQEQQQSVTQISKPLSRASSVIQESVRQEEEKEQRGPMTRARSRSKTPSSTSKAPNSKRGARGRKKALSIPSPVPSRDESVEPDSEKPETDVFQNVQGSSMTSSILAAQISSLEAQLEDRNNKHETLQQNLHSLREQFDHLSNRYANLEAESKKQLADVQAQTVQFEGEKSAWETERSQWTSQVTAFEKSKIQAEKDRDFFREQYGNASAYVTTVREENKDLEKRVQIAESQAKTGVDLIKATFELRMKTLEDDVKIWRRMAEFVLEKDMRTNDDIRRRAAEEPELRVLCVKQKRSLKESRVKMEGLAVEVQEQERMRQALVDELEQWKKENTRLHSDLNEALIKLDRIGRSGDDESIGGGEDSQGSNAHEFVYRCMWRVEGENSQGACPALFPTMRELEQHIHGGGHIS